MILPALAINLVTRKIFETDRWIHAEARWEGRAATVYRLHGRFHAIGTSEAWTHE